MQAIARPNVPMPMTKLQYGVNEMFSQPELAYTNNSGFQKYTPLPNISEARSISQPRQTVKKQPVGKQSTT